jgi:diaminohydroxyphosphoribosylaminopyrimidine deaminase / 5-amino-6-(5-phosphoribosylamino)uracil reductase
MDTRFMEQALDLAARGAGCVSPNPMVGALVVKDGQVVGRGFHEVLGEAHAEVNALDDAGEAARGATLYVTLEPCNHFGRTPPCTERILAAGVKRVVVAMTDPNPHVAGGGNERLRAAGIEVTCGVCEAGAEKLNESFIKYVQTGRPFVTLKSAMTLDGRIATRTGDARWVTGPASRQFVHELRHGVDAIMVGIGTVLADDPSLTTRMEGRTGRDPVRIILDSRLSIPLEARLLRLKSDSDTILVTGPSAPEGKAARLMEREGIQVLRTPLGEGGIDLAALMDRLGGMRITSLLLEGGSRVSASALKAGIIDKVMFFYAPKILGGDDGVPCCRGAGPEKMADCRSLSDVKVRRFGEDVMIEGYLREGASNVHGDH